MLCKQYGTERWGEEMRRWWESSWIFKQPEAQQGDVPIILGGGLTQTNFVRRCFSIQPPQSTAFFFFLFFLKVAGRLIRSSISWFRRAVDEMSKVNFFFIHKAPQRESKQSCTAGRKTFKPWGLLGWAHTSLSTKKKNFTVAADPNRLKWSEKEVLGSFKGVNKNLQSRCQSNQRLGGCAEVARTVSVISAGHLGRWWSDDTHVKKVSRPNQMFFYFSQWKQQVDGKYCKQTDGFDIQPITSHSLLTQLHLLNKTELVFQWQSCLLCRHVSLTFDLLTV